MREKNEKEEEATRQRLAAMDMGAGVKEKPSAEIFELRWRLHISARSVSASVPGKFLRGALRYGEVFAVSRVLGGKFNYDRKVGDVEVGDVEDGMGTDSGRPVKVKVVFGLAPSGQVLRPCFDLASISL